MQNFGLVCVDVLKNCTIGKNTSNKWIYKICINSKSLPLVSLTVHYGRIFFRKVQSIITMFTSSVWRSHDPSRARTHNLPKDIKQNKQTQCVIRDTGCAWECVCLCKTVYSVITPSIKLDDHVFSFLILHPSNAHAQVLPTSTGVSTVFAHYIYFIYNISTIFILENVENFLNQFSCVKLFLHALE